MGNFNRDRGGDRFGGKKRFDNDRGFRSGGNSERPQMHRATCSECGESCEVPFRPTGDKPVFCSICFGNKDTSNKSRSERRSSDRPSFGEKQMFKAVCDDCGKSCEVPFKPSSDKPVFCSDCFGKGERRESGRNERRDEGRNSGARTESSDQYKKQFEMLNNKLDSILKILSPKTSSEKIIKEVKPVVEVVKEEVKSKKVEAKKKAVAPKKEVKKAVVAKKVAAPKKAVKKAVAKKKK